MPRPSGDGMVGEGQPAAATLNRVRGRLSARPYDVRWPRCYASLFAPEGPDRRCDGTVARDHSNPNATIKHCASPNGRFPTDSGRN